MGVFDQAARFATQAESDAVLRQLLLRSGTVWPFREWLDARTVPLPGGPDRIADLVAALQDPAPEPSLLVLEFQSRHDPDKLEGTLVEAAVLRAHVRHGAERQGKYRVLTGLVYLLGRCPDAVLDMTVGGGFGTRHAVLVWNLEEDNAGTVLEAVANGQLSWGMLFWVPLMADAKQDAVCVPWREVVLQVVPEDQARANLASIALQFAELAGCRPVWQRGLEGFDMTESQVVNEWIGQGELKGELKASRQKLLEVLTLRFPGAVTEEIGRLVKEQDTLPLLDDWFRAALRANTFEQFLDVLKK